MKVCAASLGCRMINCLRTCERECLTPACVALASLQRRRDRPPVLAPRHFVKFGKTTSIESSNVSRNYDTYRTFGKERTASVKRSGPERASYAKRGQQCAQRRNGNRRARGARKRLAASGEKGAEGRARGC